MKKTLFTPDPDLVLTDYLYNLLLTEICRRFDPVELFAHHLKLDITAENRTQARSDCLWCGGKETLLIDRSNGACECGSCFEEADFLTLLCKGYQMPLTNTIARLTGILEAKEGLICTGLLKPALPEGTEGGVA